MLRNQIRFLGLTAALCAALGLAGCKTFGEVWNYEAGDRLSGPAHMQKRQVTAEPYSITVFEKVRQPGTAADIYIEGDGYYAQRKETVIGRDPTPAYPLALHLAAMDNADNVIYVARPCQYSSMANDVASDCARADWTSEKFSLQALTAMNTVLDKLKARHGISGFNLIGYDGGGAVATLLAAKRKDVLSLRTVAGNLDPALNSLNHKQPPLAPTTLNPKDFARDLATLPQHHFLGEWDRVTSPNLYQSFRNAMGPSDCIRYSLVAEMDHNGGWANHWPSLLDQPLDCNAGDK